MMRHLMIVALLIPGFAWGASCEFETFRTITNDFYGEVQGLGISDPGGKLHGDFNTYKQNWDEAQTVANFSMPADLRSVYDVYRQTYLLLGRIYQANPEVKETFDCREEFFAQEIIEAMLPGAAVRLKVPDCPTSIKLTKLQRATLRHELSPTNLYNCQYESGDAADPHSFVPEPERQSGIPAFALPMLNFNAVQIDFFKGEKPAEASVDTNPLVENNKLAVPAEEVTKKWWENMLDRFFKDETTAENDNTLSDRQATTFVNAFEIDGDVRRRAAKRQNDKDFWHNRAKLSAAALTGFESRFTTSDLAAKKGTLPTLADTNASLGRSLDKMASICEKQRTDVPCWDGSNDYPDELEDPVQSFN